MDKTFVPIRTDVVLQNETAQLYRSYQDFLQFEHLYSSAVREIQTRLEVLNEEFSVRYDHNPIHHVESRLKSTGSIIEKLRRKGLEISMESAKKNINDIAGIRVVCCYIDDVYRVEEMLLRQSDMELVKRQDYIETPNYNGYRSLHLDLRVPIYLSDRTESVLVEVQLRTVAMDFWASLEHDLKYKAVHEISGNDVAGELKDCSRIIEEAEARMQVLSLALDAEDDGAQALLAGEEAPGR